MHKPSHRLSRIETQVMREIAVLLEREVADPRIKKVAITKVSLSPDLRHAKIFFTILLTKDEKIIKKTGYALNHTVSFLRRRIAQNLDLRVTPELFFIYDTTLQKADHLMQLISGLNTDSHE